MAGDYRRFLILSSPRSGTHMLRTALGGHASLVCLPEMFNPDWIKGAPFDADTDERVILERHIFCDYPPSVSAVGFVLHRSGARFGNWPGLWRRLIDDEDLHVISLRRGNLLRRYLSWRVMREPKTDPPAPKLMDALELRTEFEQRTAEFAEFDRRFARHPLMRLTYEELCGNPAAALGRVQAFLGVTPARLEPATRPNPRRPLHEAITSFESLADSFATTPWAAFFGRGPAFAARANVTLPPPTAGAGPTDSVARSARLTGQSPKR